MARVNSARGGGGGSTGLSVGALVSPASDGVSVLRTDGARLGSADRGTREGLAVGAAVGIAVVGTAEGTAVGVVVGIAEGTAVG
jgi:hypothetical protein